MKYVKIVCAIVFTLIFTACSSSKNVVKLSNGKSIDQRLAGTWYGSQKNQQTEGVETKWVMNRKEDGTYVIDFQNTQNGEVSESTETGTWWVKGNKFYEQHEEGNTDIYFYEVLNEDRIKFKSKKLSVSSEVDTYEFIDTRKKMGGIKG